MQHASSTKERTNDCFGIVGWSLFIVADVRTAEVHHVETGLRCVQKLDTRVLRGGHSEPISIEQGRR